MPKGQIRKALSGFYYVYFEGETYQTRGRGNFRKRGISPLVGDQVAFESSNSTDGYVLDILPRKNELVRPPIANVDQAVIIMSAVEPDFSVHLLNRFLVTLEDKEITPIIYITKTDLVDAEGQMKLEQYQQDYQKIGYTMMVPQPNSEGSIALIETMFPHKITVFMGQSGVGKSTLLNRISPELSLKTAEISNALGRGRHTTRHVELIPLNGGLVADTPGFSSIEFIDIKPTDLPHLFPEFERAAVHCKYRECLHQNEPDCQVKREVASGEITQYRYDNYLQFLKEIEEQKPKYGKK